MKRNKKRFLTILISATLLLFAVVFKYYSPLKLVGEYGPESYGATLYEHVASNGETLFVLALDGGWSIDKLLLFDISTPDKPKWISTLAFPERPGNAAGITLNGNYLYVVSKGPQGIFTIDISDPKSPRIVASHAPPQNSTFNSGLIIGNNNIGYVSDIVVNGSNRLHRLTILSMEDPLEIEQLAVMPEFARPLWQTGDYLYVNVALAGVWPGGWYLGIVDVSNPEDPKLVEEMEDLLEVTAADAEDNSLYFSSYDGLLVADLSDPMASSVIKYPDNSADGIIADGKWGYFLNGRWYLYVVNLSNERKSDVIFVDKISQGVGFILVGDYIYVVDHFDGLLVYEVNRNTPSWRNAIAAFGYEIKFWLVERIGYFVP